ncbi:PHA/PHB synthase family protein [Sphingomonas cavernae]|uniref:Class I poly(R)-hydroxyalkanoic acid synthase n=1 Tax=Sphingomonas cavernae TaxID=2320861 RepID=A0A418WRZ2_9SPHN|nr:class I poly(R)-hydroxyalkanoic acid synthase [Sphingomonas cavernae]RJF94030.1 class I poly(R)-hydroxyalkanoic acid synthase [Sphingomonas cavernae]
MTDTIREQAATPPTLAEMQHWTWVLGRAQQMMLEFGIDMVKQAASQAPAAPMPGFPDMGGFARTQADFWSDSLKLWQRFIAPESAEPVIEDPRHAKDRRFSAPQWRDNPMFDLVRQSYLLISDHLLKSVDAIDGIDARQKERVRFATRGLLDAMSPSNFALTNPLVLEKTIETQGQNLLKGLEHMLRDIGKGQVTHTDPQAYELGRNIATTPGKVVKETPLYQLIQYEPTTKHVLAAPLVIFPPWINRFYILDLNPEKSFIRWAVEQGISVFVVSWKSADASMKDVVWDDYVVRGQIDAIDTVRDLLDVKSVHTIGYCVAGTTLAATLAYLSARGEADKVKSATFFTAQVDFSRSGELNLFVDDEQLALIESLSSEGFLDGRYMAATFNLLRGRDLIWNYVQNNYLLGQDYAPFDLLHWNGDTTNLPAKWHKAYLTELYRDNKLVQPGAISIAGTPIELKRIATPAYVQAGREDHIAPMESVWKITEHLTGPVRFVLAGSGHIAGVVNPPSAGKYQYWTNESAVESLAAFVDGAAETAGSWWPDWLGWLTAQSADTVPAKGGRMPGKGKLPAIEDAPGSYVKRR